MTTRYLFPVLSRAASVDVWLLDSHGRSIVCELTCKLTRLRDSQTHSTLNMFKNADDIKSNLILNALSWVEHLRPDICYFENVPGFLNFTFNGTQAGRHRIEGGIPMGGLKLLIRALIDMG